MKINKSEIPIIVISLIQVFSLFTLSTSWGKIIALISIVLGSIIAIYSYKKNKTSKQRIILWLILTVVLAVSVVLQFFSFNQSDIVLRIIRRVGIIVMGIYLWLTNE
ncbi:MAG: hypothetical protein IKC45_05765 [Clostridia bacterium]|nr:hypothetical protein [Clostridia bacterium]